MARIFADNIVYLVPVLAPPRPRVTAPSGASVLAFRPSHRPVPMVAPITRAPRRALLLMLACVLPAALGFGYAVAHQNALQRVEAVATPRALALPGGATAQLDAGAALQLVAGDAPTVALEQGSAQFTLLPGATHALRVQAGEGVVDAAAGRFRLTRRAHGAHVEALAGTLTVRLPASAQQVTLHAGQAVAYGYDRLGLVQPAR